MTAKITKIGLTNDKISGRGSLAFFLRYIEKIELYSLISSVILKKIKANPKGLQLQQFLKQIFAYFMDGTNMSMSGFDTKKNDQGYAAVLENKVSERGVEKSATKSNPGWAHKKRHQAIRTA